MDNTLKTIFDRFEGDKAVFITIFGQEIFWPRNSFDEQLENGQIKLIALCDPEDIAPLSTRPSQDLATEKQNNIQDNFTDSQQQSIAKRMLEELLNGE